MQDVREVVDMAAERHVTSRVSRTAALAEIGERSRSHLAGAGDEVASRFFDVAIESLQPVERMLGAGSPRIGELGDIHGLRVRRIEGFPNGWFYFAHGHVDVVRLLADARTLTHPREARR